MLVQGMRREGRKRKGARREMGGGGNGVDFRGDAEKVCVEPRGAGQKQTSPRVPKPQRSEQQSRSKEGGEIACTEKKRGKRRRETKV